MQQPTLPRKRGETSYWGQLSGSSLSLAVSQALAGHDSTTVIVTPDTQSARQLEIDLTFFGHQQPILQFPDWETLPYDTFSPHENITSERVKTLNTLANHETCIIIIPVNTLAHRCCPLEFITQQTFSYHCGDKLDIDNLRQRLARSGYRCVSQVAEPGEFAVRGSIIDLFPMGLEQPIRLDLFDDEIETIRRFDPDTQRSDDELSAVDILPAHEFPLTEDGINRFRQQWRRAFEVDPRNCPLYEDVSQGIVPPGTEYYFPLFFEETATLFDFIPEDALFINTNNLTNQLDSFWHEVNHRYEQYRYDITRPILPPSQLFLNTSEIYEAMNQFRQIRIQPSPVKESGISENFTNQAIPDIALEQQLKAPMAKLKQFLDATPGRVLFCAESKGRKEVVSNLLAQATLKLNNSDSWEQFLASDHDYHICTAPIGNGFHLPDAALTIITESELFGQRVIQRRRRKARYGDTETTIKNLSELTIGSPVVHLEHGIGKFVGLETITVNDIETEFVTLVYADDAKLYIPVSSLHLISRYSGVDVENAPLHRLGSSQWEKAKRKAQEQVKDVAAELLSIYARRAARKGSALRAEKEAITLFENSFDFEETPDQERAIQEVIDDLASDKAMDRLICGDVGFGKTEVAMRAAFVATQAGKQVAMLVPTTLLAQQHFESFKDRFADWPIEIELLSRFRSQKNQTDVIQKLNEGKVDIIIGTHKLLNENIKLKDLGLLIIDEEHRFGVKQKEKMKSLRSEVDILTLTATPIPRTLNMAVSGLRNLSIISTPPQKRLSIKTFVREYNTSLIQEAISREIMRGGQVYYLHNNVDTIHKVAQDLQHLIPEARVGVGHGQMRERELENAMRDFYHQRFNILVCTTIIETGIDVPNANTIIIDRADKFGLAQLHQIRGRVGRSHHQAYAYLFTPPRKAITRDAQKRLDAIESLEDLGAGFTLATHDLEIRGAGELLGDNQSGNMQAIGFNLYMEMLETAVNAIKAGKAPDLDTPLNLGAEIDMQLPALIPDDYVNDVANRLILYKRISNATNQDVLDDIKVEMIDRFGLLPKQLVTLFELTSLKIKVQNLGVKKIEATASGGKIEFMPKSSADGAQIIKLIQSKPSIYKLDGPTCLKFSLDLSDESSRINKISQLIFKVTTPEQAA